MSDCVVCGDCAQGCPTKAISFGLRWKKPPSTPAEEEADADSTDAVA